ncbi:hypothetical protein [Tenacibaculum sp. nBUS_03]|uniref:hypothetical protein n=1 Tax=Tenacibaculum sp. nBUS_03 TaxID=3395320 RepID=UPI003EBB8CA0
MLENEKTSIIIDLFLTSHDNRVSIIARKTGLSESRVNSIINKYLKGIKVNYDEI